MATITKSMVTAKDTHNSELNAYIVTWALLTTTNDIGDAYENAAYTDRSAQVVGTFGAGGNLKILGSNDGTNYTILTDPQGNALDFTTTKIEAVSEATRYIKPQVTAGDGTTSLTVSLLAVRRHGR